MVTPVIRVVVVVVVVVIMAVVTVAFVIRSNLLYVMYSY